MEGECHQALGREGSRHGSGPGLLRMPPHQEEACPPQSPGFCLAMLSNPSQSGSELPGSTEHAFGGKQHKSEEAFLGVGSSNHDLTHCSSLSLLLQQRVLRTETN